jgi:hypothetical protein
MKKIQPRIQMFIAGLIFSCVLSGNPSQTFTAVENAFVRGGSYAGQNFNNHSDQLAVKQGSVADFFRKSFIRFNLDNFELEQAGQAFLRVYCYKIEKSDVKTHISALAIDGAWDENSITWDNSPPFTGHLANATVETGRYIQWDVSGWIASALKEGRKSVTIALHDLEASNNGVFFNDLRSDNKPQLLVMEQPAPEPQILTGTYYLDAVSGNNQNSGTSPEHAWKSLEQINRHVFGPGASILFKAGQAWEGSLHLTGKGMEGKPITTGMYGTGNRPAIHGNGVFAAVHIRNSEFIILRDLEITNYDASEEGGMSMDEWERRNITDWFEKDNPPQHVSGTRPKVGVLVSATDVGELKHIHLLNLHVHAVNGAIDQQQEDTKHNGGIFIEITGTLIPTWFNDLRIEGCHIHDVDRTGLSNRSSWDRRTLTTSENWTPLKNFVIRNNLFERAGANALIVRVADAPLMEYNIFHQNGIKGSGNAAFNFNTDNALWQYNIARYTKKNQNDADAGGLDSDFRTKNTIIQYNYLHDNDFGMLVTGGPSFGFNDSTIVRYNIFERDGQKSRDGLFPFAFKISGKATNTFVHNNVFYLSPEQSRVRMVYHGRWVEDPHNSFYYNNIFYLGGANHSVNLGQSTSNHFHNNLYFSTSAGTSWPVTSNAVFADPLLKAPGSGTDGYYLQENSPAIAAGLRMGPVFPSFDFYNNQISSNQPIDLGIHQVGQITTGMSPQQDGQKNIIIYPNPSTCSFSVKVQGMKTDNASIYLQSADGRKMLLGHETLSGGEGRFSYDLREKHLTPGFYLILVQNHRQLFIEKMINTLHQ